MLRNMMGWCGSGLMLTFLELAHMVDATSHVGALQDDVGGWGVGFCVGCVGGWGVGWVGCFRSLHWNTCWLLWVGIDVNVP